MYVTNIINIERYIVLSGTKRLTALFAAQSVLTAGVCSKYIVCVKSTCKNNKFKLNLFHSKTACLLELGPSE